jgi:hypothetical protein
MQDVLWRDHDGNRVAVALMSGTRILDQGPMIPGPPGTGWVVAGAGADFNGDGMSDMHWYNPTTKRAVVWLMAGTEPLERGPEIPGPGEGWYDIPALDFNRDGMSDLLWFNPTTNRIAVWLMAGTEPFEYGPEIPGPPGDGWLAGFGVDMDRDGMADVFWYNSTTHRMAVWLMDSTEVRERGGEIPAPASADWILAAAGDYNGDHIADPAWFNTRTKRVTESLMFGTGLLEQSPEIAAPPGEGWILGGSADYNGDGLFDLIWLNARPLRISVWLMNGTVPLEIGAEIPGPR